MAYSEGGRVIRHVLITGPPGVGKTTLIVKVCEILQLNSIPIQGFYTEEVAGKSGTRLGFDVVSLDGNRAPLARVTDQSPPGVHNYRREYKVGKYSVDIPSFESVALPALKPQTNQEQSESVYVIDEIGKMELFSNAFAENVDAVFERVGSVTLSSIPVQKGRMLMVVDKIKARNDVDLIYVNRDNRDELVKPIVEKLAVAYQAFNGS